MRVIVVSSQPALALALSTQLPDCEARSATSAASAADIAAPESLILLDTGSMSESEEWIEQLRYAGVDNGIVVIDAPEARGDGPVVYLERPFSLSDLADSLGLAQSLIREASSATTLAASKDDEGGSPSEPDGRGHAVGHSEAPRATDPATPLPAPDLTRTIEQPGPTAELTTPEAAADDAKLFVAPLEPAAPQETASYAEQTEPPTEPMRSSRNDELPEATDGQEQQPGLAEAVEDVEQFGTDRSPFFTDSADAPSGEGDAEHLEGTVSERVSPSEQDLPIAVSDDERESQPTEDDGEPEARRSSQDDTAQVLRIRPGVSTAEPPNQAQVFDLETRSEPEREKPFDASVTTTSGADERPGASGFLPRLLRRLTQTPTEGHSPNALATSDQDAVIHARVTSGLKAATHLENILTDLAMLQSVAGCGALLLEQVASAIDVDASAVALRGRAGDLEIVAASGQIRGANDGRLPLDHPFVRAVERRGGALLLSPTDAVRGLLAGVPLSEWPVLLAASVRGDDLLDGLVLVGRAEPADPGDLDRLYATVDDGSDIVRLAAIIRRLPRPEGAQMDYLHSWMR